MYELQEESTLAGASTNNLSKTEVLRKIVELTKKQHVNALRFHRAIRAAHYSMLWELGERNNWEVTK